MFYRVGRARVAVFLGMSVVVVLAEELKGHHIEPFSWPGVGITIPTLLVAALLLSFLLHGGRSR
jgi:hypothetical protein